MMAHLVTEGGGIMLSADVLLRDVQAIRLVAADLVVASYIFLHRGVAGSQDHVVQPLPRAVEEADQSPTGRVGNTACCHLGMGLLANRPSPAISASWLSPTYTCSRSERSLTCRRCP